MDEGLKNIKTEINTAVSNISNLKTVVTNEKQINDVWVVRESLKDDHWIANMEIERYKSNTLGTSMVYNI